MNNTDSTSFQSILAGVERLRKQKEGAADKDRNNDLVTKDKDTNFIERKQTAHVQEANKVPPEITMSLMHLINKDMMMIQQSLKRMGKSGHL